MYKNIYSTTIFLYILPFSITEISVYAVFNKSVLGSDG